MSTQAHIDAAAESIADLNQVRRTGASNEADRAKNPQRELSADQIWARQNLRWRDGRPLTDIANCLRVLERHKDFTGRYKFNDVLGRVTDKGSIMLDWRQTELTAVIQERFIPEVALETVMRALVVAAVRSEK